MGPARRAHAPSLVARVARTLDERALIDRGATVLVACSGGPDSIAMLDVLARLASERALSVHVASVDHGLRPEAKDEVAFVGAFASRLAVPFHPVALGLPAGTTQAGARTARYRALLDVAARISAGSATRVAVGHTLDDQAETVLARLLRGAGLRGLRGVRPIRADGVVRPLLDATRQEVRAHLAAHGIASIEDPSNADRRFLRVRVRQSLLPQLALEAPAVARHLAALADEAEDLASWVDEQTAELTRTGMDVLDARLVDAPGPVRAQTIAEIVATRTGRAPGRRARLEVERALREGGSVLVGSGLALEGPPGQLSFRPAKRRGRVQRPKE